MVIGCRDVTNVLGFIFFRPAEEAAMKTIGLLVTSTLFRERTIPQNNPTTPFLTPETHGISSPAPLVTDTVSMYNSANNGHHCRPHRTHTQKKRELRNSQLKTTLDKLSNAEQFSVVQKASEDCLLVCSAMAPGVVRRSSSPWLSLQKEKSWTVHHLVI